MQISSVGFGCYRTDISIDEHQNALSHALENGINVIDTSANYFNGGSELLVGNVLNKLVNDGKIKKKNILLVTKGGYIQGTNYRNATELEKSGKLFSGTVKIQPGLWHCIHPDFLEYQLTLQFERLKQDYIDIYLLHNPEYFLQKAKEDKTEKQSAAAEYYDRIKMSFEFLESKVKEGKILSYGISSNTFVGYSEKYDFTSLEKVIDIAESISAENHFRAIQFPLNLLESGALIKNQLQKTKTLLELAKTKNLKVFINRPLNAITSKGLVRFADFESEAFEEKDFIKKMKLVSLMEEDLLNEKIEHENISRDDKKLFSNLLNTGKVISENWKFFGSIEHFNDVISQIFAPKIDSIIKSMNEIITDNSIKELTEKYLKECYLLLNLTGRYYKIRAAKRSAFIHGLINNSLDKKYHNLTLSQKTYLILKSVTGVDCVLTGMRKENYVNDALKILSENKISNAEKIIEYVSKEVENAGT